MKIILALIIIINIHWLTSSISAQQIEKCGSIVDSPSSEVVAWREQMESYLQQWKTKKMNSNNILSGTLIVIPVVVHVVYRIADENISDAQIVSNINVLNEDFRRMIGTPGYNTNNTIGLDMKIEFRLAVLDPNNNPTNGITRTQTTHKTFNRSNVPNLNDIYDVKSTSNGGIDPWDPDLYLNIWVCNFRIETFREAIGYGDLPTGNSADDLVVSWCYGIGDGDLTTSSKSLTGHGLSHEIGHYLGLYHTFEGACTNSDCTTQGDRCCDTPPEEKAAGGCPTGRTSCSTASQIENYMSQSNDACVNLFTIDQGDRMDYILSHQRLDLRFDAVPNFFPVFGTHVGHYEYNETTDIIAVRGVSSGSTVYAPMIIPSGSSVIMRSKTGELFRDGFEARYGSEMRAYIDNELPSFSKSSYQVEEKSPVIIPQPSVIATPNPASSVIRLSFQYMKSGHTDISFYSAVGMEISDSRSDMQILSANTSRDFDCSEWSPGLYYAVVRSGESVMTTSFIVAR